MDKTNKATFAEVGSGSIDYKAIFEERKKAGNQHIFIEQDLIKIDPFESHYKKFQLR